MVAPHAHRGDARLEAPSVSVDFDVSHDVTRHARKSRTAARLWVYIHDYADAKGEVVEGIIARALAEQGDAKPLR